MTNAEWNEQIKHALFSMWPGFNSDNRYDWNEHVERSWVKALRPYTVHQILDAFDERYGSGDRKYPRPGEVRRILERTTQTHAASKKSDDARNRLEWERAERAKIDREFAELQALADEFSDDELYEHLIRTIAGDPVLSHLAYEPIRSRWVLSCIAARLENGCAPDDNRTPVYDDDCRHWTWQTPNDAAIERARATVESARRGGVKSEHAEMLDFGKAVTT